MADIIETEFGTLNDMADIIETEFETLNLMGRKLRIAYIRDGGTHKDLIPVNVQALIRLSRQDCDGVKYQYRIEQWSENFEKGTLKKFRMGDVITSVACIARIKSKSTHVVEDMNVPVHLSIDAGYCVELDSTNAEPIVFKTPYPVSVYENFHLHPLPLPILLPHCIAYNPETHSPMDNSYEIVFEYILLRKPDITDYIFEPREGIRIVPVGGRPTELQDELTLTKCCRTYVDKADSSESAHI